MKIDKEHHYKVNVKWTGNKGTGTDTYRSYERSHSIQVENKPEISGSSDPAFRGDKLKYNPEDLLVASLSACHMLSYLHACAAAGVVVVDYSDQATGIMMEEKDESGRFTKVTLNPVVIVTKPEMVEKANALHKKAHHLCFIANSVNFEVEFLPACKVKDRSSDT